MDRTDGNGLEAYRDDPDYTAPEMEVRADDHASDRTLEQGVALATGMSLGFGGGAMAGEIVVEDIERATG